MDHHLPETLRELIELASANLGSQGALARALGQHTEALSNWKRGRTCSLTTQATIAELAGVDAKEWVWREVCRLRGADASGRGRLRRILKASAVGMTGMARGLGAQRSA